MATPRIPFSYSNFFRSVRSCKPQTYRSIRNPPKPTQRKARLHTSSRLSQETYPARYGPAATQNLPPPPKPSEPLYPEKAPDQPKKEYKEDPNSNYANEDVEHHLQRDGGDTQYAAREGPVEVLEQVEEDGEPLGNKELDIVLSVPSPSEVKGSDPHRHPHLEASPYEHHFDTYSLVQELGTKDAYSHEQAVTLMKAVRLMLAINLDVAKEGLVSKSDTENEAYLFRAACSELHTTLQTQRHSEMLKQRSGRAQLQHEFDLLNQKVTQDLMTMREELKGMFNDRKLGLQEEKRKIDGRIQECNYQITVLLNSEAKSEVEGLRWVLTRRAAMAIAISACMHLPLPFSLKHSLTLFTQTVMIISALNYSSIKLREKEDAEKKRKAAKQKEKDRQEREKQQYTTPSRDQAVQAGGGITTGSYEESLG